jgi:hypothetical protein
MKSESRQFTSLGYGTCRSSREVTHTCVLIKPPAIFSHKVGTNNLCIIYTKCLLHTAVSLAASHVKVLSGLDPGPVYVRFVMDKVAMEQVILRALRFFPVKIISPTICTHLHLLSQGRAGKAWKSSKNGIFCILGNIVKKEYVTVRLV